MKRQRRRIIAVISIVVTLLGLLVTHIPTDQFLLDRREVAATGPAVAALDTLEVKGRASKAGYSRSAFGEGWKVINGCDTRQIILHRDLRETVVDSTCRVTSGVLQDPYTNTTINYQSSQSSAVQIDHIVALSDAWQKGAQNLTTAQREQLANDPLELLAVDGPSNQQKGDGDAATWLPDNKDFRCEYVSRQIAVKKKYHLWVTQAEYDAMKTVLSRCPDFPLYQLPLPAL